MMRIFNGQSKTITGAALVLGATSFLSRIMGVVRDRLFASQFGAGDTLDIYFAAFRIPDFIYNILIIGALSAGFIPLFTKLYLKDKESAWRFVSSVINGLCLILGALSLLLFALAPTIVPYLVPGFDRPELEQTIQLTRIMLLSPMLLGMSAIVSGVLQSFKNFFIYSLTPILYNLGIIFGTIVFVPIWGVRGLAFGVILGALLHLVAQLPTLFKNGFHYQLKLRNQEISLKELIKMSIPRTLTLGVSQINVLVTTIIASTLTTGSISIFTFASNLQYFPVGIIGISFAIAAFPTLSELVAENNYSEFHNKLLSSVRQILFLIIPCTVLFLLLRAQIVRVILGSGEFNWQDTIVTANALAFFALSFFAQCLIPLLTRAFYALENTWTPFVITLISTLCTVIGSLVLKESFGVAGIALAYTLGTIIQVTVTWFMIKQATGGLHFHKLLPMVYKMAVASIGMALTVQLIKAPIAMIVDMGRFWGIFTQGFVASLLGLSAYVGICYLLRLEEVMHFVRTFHKKWLKPINVEEVVEVEKN